jgi:hypothetical protein
MNKPFRLGATGLFLTFVLVRLAGALTAEAAPQFIGIQFLTNQEMLLKLSAPTGFNYRIEASTNLLQWQGVMTLLSTGNGLLQPTDSAAPFLFERFYRAVQLAETNVLTGDHLVTASGEIVIHPLFHASSRPKWHPQQCEPFQATTGNGPGHRSSASQVVLE